MLLVVGKNSRRLTNTPENIPSWLENWCLVYQATGFRLPWQAFLAYAKQISLTYGKTVQSPDLPETLKWWRKIEQSSNCNGDPRRSVTSHPPSAPLPNLMKYFSLDNGWL